MALHPDKTRKKQRNTTSIASDARELFREWRNEEEAGYTGEIPWEEFKRELNAARPSHNKPFLESS